MLSEQYSELLDACNVTCLLIRRCLFDIEIKTIKVNSHAGIIVAVSTIKRTDTGPAWIVGTVSAPKEVGQVDTISGTIQVIVASSSTKREKNLGVGMLLTVVDRLLKAWTLLVQEVVLRVVDAIITRARVISIPTLITESLCNQSVRLRWEEVEKSDRNDIHVWLFAIVCQIKLV